MSETTNIAWADSTFNPWIGCTKVGPGCTGCYAEALMDRRMGRVKWGAGELRQRTSAINGVTLHLTNRDAGPEASHAAWMSEKLAAGWVYGPVKDPEAKTHPCIVPFAELPREQQAKDFIFRAVVHALA